MYRLKVPLVSRSRVMLSSQTLCPSSWSLCVAFIASPPHRFESRTSGKQVTQITVEQVSNAVNGNVGCSEGSESLRVARVLSLSGKNGGHARAPSFLDRGENSRLVIDEYVVQRRIAGLYIIQCEFLVDIDQHM